MPDTVIVAIISLVGTLIGAFSGMRVSIYRIEQLEKAVNKHNCLIERVFKVEGRLDTHDTEIEDLKKRGS